MKRILEAWINFYLRDGRNVYPIAYDTAKEARDFAQDMNDGFSNFKFLYQMHVRRTVEVNL